MRKPRIPASKYSKLVRDFALQRTALDAAEEARVHRNTANRCFNNLRRLILEKSVVPRFTGEVEIDIAYFGKMSKKKRAWLKSRGKPVRRQKIIVFAIAQRNGHIYTEIVPDGSAKTLFPIIRKVVEQGSTIYSDGAGAFLKIVEMGYKHFSVNHSIGEFYNPKTTAHTGLVDSFWGLSKGRLKSFHGISRKTALLHIKESEFRFNFRRKLRGKESIESIIRRELKMPKSKPFAYISR